jgi:hypothetical protein
LGDELEIDQSAQMGMNLMHELADAAIGRDLGHSDGRMAV